MESTQKFYGWKFAGVLWLLFLLNLGIPLYGGVIAIVYMMKDLAMDRTFFGLGMTGMFFVAGIVSPLVATSISRLGIRGTFLLGTVIQLIGSLILAFATSKWQYLFAMTVCFGLGGAFNTTMTVSTAISRWFVKYRGRAMALVLTSAGFAGMLGAPAMQWLMTTNGGNWSQGWLFVTGINVVSGLIAYAFVKESPQAMGQHPDGLVPQAATAQAAWTAGGQGQTWTPGAVYRTTAFWLILVACMANYFPYFFVSSHWVLLLRGVGISPASSAFAFGLFTMISILGRLVGGWLTDKVASRYVLMLGLAMMAVASYGTSFISSEMMAYLCSGLLGLGFGCALVVQNTILANYFGVAVFAQVFGMMMMIICSASAFGGVIGGKVFDMFRSYGPMLNVNIVLYILGIVAMFFAIPAHEKAASQAAANPPQASD